MESKLLWASQKERGTSTKGIHERRLLQRVGHKKGKNEVIDGQQITHSMAGTLDTDVSRSAHINKDKTW
jgi:hypothetical protein